MAIHPTYESITHHDKPQTEMEGEDDEEKRKVSTLELFSDLLIVVSIHLVAESL